MLQKRVIPCLLLHKGGLYKTQCFRKPTYIGDPINAIKIFNDKEVDELIFLDIDATVKKKEPNYSLIENIAGECFMPLCYGGGVKTIKQMKRIYALGVEKISLSSAALENPHIIAEAAAVFGKQSVVVTLDVKKDFFRRKKIFVNNGKKNTKQDVLEFVGLIQELGAGELVINSADNDGLMTGYDIELLKAVKKHAKVPVIALGGAGNLDHIKAVFDVAKVDAVACGSMFVYQGALKGVLINYPPYGKMQDFFK